MAFAFSRFCFVLGSPFTQGLAPFSPQVVPTEVHSFPHPQKTKSTEPKEERPPPLPLVSKALGHEQPVCPFLTAAPCGQTKGFALPSLVQLLALLLPHPCSSLLCPHVTRGMIVQTGSLG